MDGSNLVCSTNRLGWKKYAALKQQDIARTPGSSPTAGVPWEAGEGRERGDEVEDGPGDDDAVVDVQEEHDEHCGDADTWSQGVKGRRKESRVKRGSQTKHCISNSLFLARPELSQFI